MASKWQNKFNWNQIKDDIEKEKDSKSKKYKDDRLFYPDWKAAVAKNKFYTLRFLPDQEGNPFVHYYTHGFQYPNSDGTGKKWYINNCISTFGWDPKCPICAKNSEYYDSAFESDKALGKERARKQHWVSNILVVNDPINPDNNGKIFLYKYGYKIYQKIEKQMFPSEIDLSDDDFQEFVPFDLFNGADFKLKITMQGEYPNYDTSSWSQIKAIANGDEDEIDVLMEQTHDLSEFLDPKKYPTVEETNIQLAHILGVAPEVGEEEEQEEPIIAEKEESSPTEESEVTFQETTSDENDSDELDDDEAFFKNLAKS